MSMEFLNLAFSAHIKGASKAVFVALADRANRGGYCFMSLSDIAFRAGCDRRTAIRSISTLEALGHVAVIRDKGLTNHYMILTPDVEATSGNMSPVPAVETVETEQNLSTTIDTVSPEKVIHTSDAVSKTRDMVSNTSDVVSYKPNITQLTQKPRTREVGENLPNCPERPSRKKSKTGAEGLRGIREILSGIAQVKPSITPSTKTP